MKPFEPDFDQMLAVLNNQQPARPVLFELFMNYPLYEIVNEEKFISGTRLENLKFVVRAFRKMGYDYATVHASDFRFGVDHEQKETRSINQGAGIHDEASFEAFLWPDPEDFSSDLLSDIKPYLPDGMKLMLMGPGGVLENVIELVGYEPLCLMVYDEPDLAQRIFDAVGARLLKYYQLALEHDTVGLVSANDDWGFNSQPFLSPEMMRRYVFPWHQQIVDAVHQAGRKVFLHSCGNLDSLMDDVVAMGFDAKHSFEDKILPIEEAYERYHPRIALLGGIDVDFLCSRSPEEIYQRTIKMLERTLGRGGWAVGSGNSIPEYIPPQSLFAMQKAARDFTY